MTVYAITDTKKGRMGLRLLIFKLPGAYLEIWIGGGREWVGSRLLPSPPLP